MSSTIDTPPHRPWRKIAFVLCALACALAIAPISLWLAACVAVLAFAPLVISSVRATRARLGEAPPIVEGAPAHAGMREFASLPFENPFDPAGADLPLDRRISLAAEASAEFSRGVSVLYLQTPATVDPEGALAVLRGALRPSDHAEMIGPDEIVACLNLIRDLSNVDGVVARLTQRLHERGWPQDMPPRFGRALYPMHGYSGADLIAAARAQVRPPAPQPRVAPVQAAQPGDRKPRRRKAASAR